jgi:hypothetical protein
MSQLGINPTIAGFKLGAEEADRAGVDEAIEFLADVTGTKDAADCGFEHDTKACGMTGLMLFPFGKLGKLAKAMVVLKRADDIAKLPVLVVDAGRMPSIARNVQNALDAGHPGVLSRITDKAQIKGNRSAACKGFCGVGSPDEYPFASTAQGGAGAWVSGVPLPEQRIQGGVMASFYAKYGIGDGDMFRVVVTGLPK